MAKSIHEISNKIQIVKDYKALHSEIDRLITVKPWVEEDKDVEICLVANKSQI